MKIKKEWLDAAKKQLTLDYNCSVLDFSKSGISLSNNQLLEGRRIYGSDGCFMKMLCFYDQAVISADEKILPWVEENLGDVEPSWLFKFSNLNRINKKLNEFGHEIADMHHYYLPKSESDEIKPMHTVKWFEQEDIPQFRGDQRFQNAFAFNEQGPDVLAVAAFDGGRIMVMAGASADSETMWQIGIDVLPEYGGRGIATNLTGLIKQDIIKRGRVPFYGTVESHNLSKNVALQAGFVPVWAEAYTQPCKEQSANEKEQIS